MKVAYFDCFSGVSGDMILGSLMDAGADIADLEWELAKLGLPSLKLHVESVTRNGLTGKKFSVTTAERGIERTFRDICDMIDRSCLSEKVKLSCRKIFTVLAAAEGKIHGVSPESVHFHEVGALDSIVDVVGAVLVLQRLRIDEIYASRIHIGTGFVETRHGLLPVPAPATLEILKGVPVYSRGIESELTTPTGAAILKTLTRKFGVFPPIRVETVGYGAGSKTLEIPNMLRVCLGDSSDRYETDEVSLVETNIDDMNPELFAYLSERLAQIGALDVYHTPVSMKKGRPGVLLSVLLEEDRLDAVLEVLFRESTTLGVRIQKVQRAKLTREIITVTTPWGEVRVKLGRLRGGVVNIAPEYEDCRVVAAKAGVALKEVYETVRREVPKDL